MTTPRRTALKQLGGLAAASLAPERTCDTVSVSLPSWPFG
jgi:hypothetical protein